MEWNTNLAVPLDQPGFLALDRCGEALPSTTWILEPGVEDRNALTVLTQGHWAWGGNAPRPQTGEVLSRGEVSRTEPARRPVIFTPSRSTVLRDLLRVFVAHSRSLVLET